MSQQQSQNLGFPESKACEREGEEGEGDLLSISFLGKGFPTLLSLPPYTPPKLGTNKKTESFQPINSTICNLRNNPYILKRLSEGICAISLKKLLSKMF